MLAPHNGVHRLAERWLAVARLHRLWMPAALLTGATLIGCSSNKLQGSEAVAAELGRMRAAATAQVGDTERRSRLLQAIDGLQADLGELRSVDFDTTTRIRALNTRPDVTRTEMERALDAFDQQRRAARDKVLQRHFELTALTTPQEWKQLAKLERKALQAAVQ
jgi:hypothetical protein